MVKQLIKGLTHAKRYYAWLAFIVREGKSGLNIEFNPLLIYPVIWLFTV